MSERRAALTALTRKYGETVEEVLAWSETSAARLLDLDGTDERIEALRAEQQSLRAELGEVAQTLSGARSEAAARLSDEVTAELSLLAMPDARLEITVTQHDAEPPAGDPPPSGSPLRVGNRWLRHTASGVDEVEFLLAANTGSEPRPLHKGASGGELSRVMLALEVALAGTSPVPTFVFDEVDAGVGGAAAVEVGRRLAQLARTAQVLVVTHLPQVAAYADRHVLVEKASDGSVTSSGLTVLDDAAREKELSRMLAGMAESDTGPRPCPRAPGGCRPGAGAVLRLSGYRMTFCTRSSERRPSSAAGDVERRAPHVIGPVVHELGRPVDPLGDHHVEVGEEAARQLVERGALGERTAPVEVGAGGGEVLLVLLEHPRARGREVGEDVGLAAAVGEADLDQLLELEGWPSPRLPQPGRERAPTLARDGVPGPATAADGVVGRFGVPVGHQLLGLLVELALGARPHPAQAAVHLLHELVGGPRLHREQAEDRVRRRRQRRGT